MRPEIQLGFNAADWSNYNQRTIQFDRSGQWQENRWYTVYQNNQLIWGAEPVSPAFVPVTDFAPQCRLELSLRGGSSGPLAWNSTGTPSKPTGCGVKRPDFLQPAFAAGCLRDGANYLRIYRLPPGPLQCDAHRTQPGRRTEYAGVKPSATGCSSPGSHREQKRSSCLPKPSWTSRLYTVGEYCPSLQAWTEKTGNT